MGRSVDLLEWYGCLCRLHAGQGLSLAPPVGDQDFAGLTLRPDGLKGTSGPATLDHLPDGSVDLAKALIEIADRVRLNLDSGGEHRGFGTSAVDGQLQHFHGGA
jgi:hypothetical protein